MYRSRHWIFAWHDDDRRHGKSQHNGRGNSGRLFPISFSTDISLSPQGDGDEDRDDCPGLEEVLDSPRPAVVSHYSDYMAGKNIKHITIHLTFLKGVDISDQTIGMGGARHRRARTWYRALFYRAIEWLTSG